MDKKQFALVFVIILAVWTVGAGLSPLLPVYARQLDATPALTGLFMAFAWLLVSLGGLAGGWLSDRTGRRRLWIFLGSLLAPACLYGMSQTRSFWLYTVLTALVWFAGGVAIALSRVLVGLQAARHERGKFFGLLAMTGSLGGLIGGALLGPAADRWGYAGMFLLAGGVWVLPSPLLLLVRDPPTAPQAPRPKGAPRAPSLGPAFYLLCLASFVAAAGTFVVNMTRSLAMHGAGYAATAIASTGMAAGLVGLPVRPLAGWLSDRLGRKQLILGAFILSLVGRCLFIPAAQLWHFWVATALVALSGVSDPIRNAWVSDLAPQESYGRALAQMGASGWVGGVLGFGLAGLAIQGLGVPWTFAAAALSMLAAIGLVLAIRTSPARAPVVEIRAEGVAAAAQGGDSPLS